MKGLKKSNYSSVEDHNFCRMIKPVKGIYLSPEDNLERSPCFWVQDEIGGVQLFIGNQVRVRVELVKEAGVCQVEVGLGDIGGEGPELGGGAGGGVQ